MQTLCVQSEKARTRSTTRRLPFLHSRANEIANQSLKFNTIFVSNICCLIHFRRQATGQKHRRAVALILSKSTTNLRFMENKCVRVNTALTFCRRASLKHAQDHTSQARLQCFRGRKSIGR